MGTTRSIAAPVSKQAVQVNLYPNGMDRASDPVAVLKIQADLSGDGHAG